MGTIPFSEQLRQAIESSGTSRYALARAVGIADSALSRFMSGKRGLNLASLDKLADVLGLQIVVRVQKVPRRSPRGRKPEKGKLMLTKSTKSSWRALAYSLARDAHENHYESRRGVWFIEDEGVLGIYNNNPYANYPNLRDEELAEFRRRVRTEGIKELAYATYPPEGQEQAGYTYGLLIDAGNDRMNWVVETMSEILARSRETRSSFDAKHLGVFRP